MQLTSVLYNVTKVYKARTLTVLNVRLPNLLISSFCLVPCGGYQFKIMSALGYIFRSVSYRSGIVPNACLHTVVPPADVNQLPLPIM